MFPQFPGAVYHRKKSNPKFLLHDNDNEHLVYGAFGLGSAGSSSEHKR